MEKREKWLDKINEEPFIMCVCLSVILNIMIEVISRRSIAKTFYFITHQPYMLLLGIGIVLSCYMLTYFSKKRLLYIAIVTIIWAGFGITNFIVTHYRLTPFSAMDMRLLKAIRGIFKKYISKEQWILIGIGLLLIGVLVYVLAKKVPKAEAKNRFYKGICFTLLAIGGTYGLTLLGHSLHLIRVNNGNVSITYENCGFVYCFANTALNMGINRPIEYSKKEITQIKSEVAVRNRKETEKKYEYSTLQPNIIYVQLESFFNVNYVKGVSFSENPVPNFEALQTEWPSGFFGVPSFGAGTANTEFEVMTGMNLDHFGFLEYPYRTALLKRPCESICFNLQELGYKTHAIHNNTGDFYDRNYVFENLGYDTFTSVEYMNDIERNPVGWAKDSCLINEIISSMNATEERDFIYTITVQAHGKYPTEKLDDGRKITVTGGIEDEAYKNQLEYYTNQIHEVDQFVADLVERLARYPEPVYVVFYGDHLPTFDWKRTDLINGNLYETEYIIWNNLGLKGEDRSIEAYQLSAYVLGMLRLHNGTLTKFHQYEYKEDDYQEKLKMLEYDMLYGKKYLYGGTIPYEPTDIQMGTVPITIKRITCKQGNVYIQGKNFTESSVVYVNGKKQETEFFSPEYLILRDKTLEDMDRVLVKQLVSSGTVLSKTNQYIYDISNE